MIKYQLIKIKDKFILVSDEEMKDGDWICNLLLDFDMVKLKNCPVNLLNEINKIKHSRKIIAGIDDLPLIDFSLLSEEDIILKLIKSLRYKIWDVEIEVNERKFYSHDIDDEDYKKITPKIMNGKIKISKIIN